MSSLTVDDFEIVEEVPLQKMEEILARCQRHGEDMSKKLEKLKNNREATEQTIKEMKEVFEERKKELEELEKVNAKLDAKLVEGKEILCSVLDRRAEESYEQQEKYLKKKKENEALELELAQLKKALEEKMKLIEQAIVDEMKNRVEYDFQKVAFKRYVEEHQHDEVAQSIYW